MEVSKKEGQTFQNTFWQMVRINIFHIHRNNEYPFFLCFASFCLRYCLSVCVFVLLLFVCLFVFVRKR